MPNPNAIGRGGSALRFLGGTGLGRPADATKPDEKTGKSPLQDYVEALGASKDALQQHGLTTSTPSLPGWSGDMLNEPSIPDLGALRDAYDKRALVKSVQNFTGQVPVTTWGTRHGQKPGQFYTSPAAQAAEEQASSGWALEQHRVDNANKIYSFQNQYSYLKSQARNKDQQNAIDAARDVMTRKGMQDYVEALLGAQKEYAKGERERKEGEAAQRQENWQNNYNLREQSLRDRESGLSLREAADRRAEEEHTLKMRPNKQETQEYAVAHGAQGAIDNMISMLDSDPELTRYTRGSWTWKNLRASTDPKAQALAQQRDLAHHNLMQIDPRRSLQMGASLLGNTLTKAGDDQPVDIATLRILHGQAGIVRNGIRYKYHDSPYMGEQDWAGITAPFDQANAAFRAQYGVQRPLESMGDEELMRRGQQAGVTP